MADTKISNMPTIDAVAINNALDYVSFPVVHEVGGNFSNKRVPARDLKEVFKPADPAFLLGSMEGNAPVDWNGALFNTWTGSSATLMYSSEASWVAPIAGQISNHVHLFSTGTWRINITSRLRFNNGSGPNAALMDLPDGILEYGWQISNLQEPGLMLRPSNAFSSRHSRIGRSIATGSEYNRQLSWTDTFYVVYIGDEQVNYSRVEPSFYVDLDPGATITPGSVPWISAVISAELLATDTFPN